MNKIITNKAGNLSLELRQESMSAWLTIKQTGKLLDEHDILALIEEAGIKTGFNEALAYIREKSLEKEYDVPFPIAICNRAESTTTLRYRFNPDIQPDPVGALSYAALEALNFVKAGEVVAEYSNNLFEQGGSIYDIFGELIDPGNVDPERAAALAGQNISYNAANRDYLANKAGYPFLDSDGKICLLDMVVLNSAELPGSGKLILKTDAVLEGDLAHAELFCEGNLRVNGAIHNSKLFCRKDLFVEGEIVSCRANGINTLGDLVCKDIIDSKVLCRGTMRFSGKVVDSNLACEGEINGDPDNSEICGGLVQSGSSIYVAKAGCSEGRKTEIEIAIMPYQRSLLMQMTRDLVRLKEDPETNAQAIHELDQLIQKCEIELDEQLNQFLQRPAEDKKSIKVSGTSLPPVLYRVLKHAYYRETREQNLEFIEKND